MEKCKLLILFGGQSNEYEVSLMSAYSILSHVNRDKYDVTAVGITRQGDWYRYNGELSKIRDGSWCEDATLERAALSPSHSDSALLVFSADGKSVKRLPIDVVFPVMHGANAEDGTLQGLLQISGIPFVGCKCATSAIAMDKSTTKLLLKSFGIPMAKSLIVRADAMAANETAIVERCEKIAPYPLFVKPANAGSSVGAARADDRDSLRRAIYAAGEVDSKVLIEEYIGGKEIEVAVMGKRRFIASTCGQIVTSDGFYDYNNKYGENSTAACQIPADIMPETAEQLQLFAKKICSVLDVEGLARVDFFVRLRGLQEEIIFNEINTLPGFTDISMYPKLFLYDGMSYSAVIDRLIDIALGKEA